MFLCSLEGKICLLFNLLILLNLQYLRIRMKGKDLKKKLKMHLWLHGWSCHLDFFWCSSTYRHPGLWGWNGQPRLSKLRHCFKNSKYIAIAEVMFPALKWLFLIHRYKAIGDIYFQHFCCGKIYFPHQGQNPAQFSWSYGITTQTLCHSGGEKTHHQHYHHHFQLLPISNEIITGRWGQEYKLFLMVLPPVFFHHDLLTFLSFSVNHMFAFCLLDCIC